MKKRNPKVMSIQLPLDGIPPAPPPKPPKEDLPVITPRDSILRALAKVPLPSRELVRAGVDQNIEKICKLWAIHIAADNHFQTSQGERFERASNEEAARYVPHIELFWDSKSSAGGATRLTQNGYNKLMYGARHIDKGVPFDPSVHILTNDGYRGAGYRFIANGQQVAALYKRVAESITHEPLRNYFLEALREATEKPDNYARTRPSPDYHRLVARIGFGHNRARVESESNVAAGYLDVSFGKAGLEEAIMAIFPEGMPEPDNRRVKAVVGMGNILEITAHPDGWKLTDSGRFQISNLAASNIPEPTSDYDVVNGFKNLQLEKIPGGGLRCLIPTSLFRRSGSAGDGLPARSSGGSRPGRARSLIDRNPIESNIVDYEQLQSAEIQE